jgi:hypothetical protein
LMPCYPGGLLHRFCFPEAFSDVPHFAGFSLEKCTFHIPCGCWRCRWWSSASCSPP